MDSQDNLWMTFTNAVNDERIVKYNGNEWQYWLRSDMSFLPSTINGIGLDAVDELGRWLTICYHTTGIHQDKVYEIDGTNWKSYSTAFYPMDGIVARDVGLTATIILGLAAMA